MMNNNHKRSWTEKLGDFISGKGFYFVVLICVAAIALSGYYLVQGLGGEDDPGQPVAGSASIVDSPSANPSPRVTAQPTPVPTAKPSPAPTVPPTAQPSPAVSSQPQSTPTAALVFTWPVNGAVIADYSVEALAYSETMGDWRTHDGMDLAVSLGTKVIATAAGTVSKVFEDPFMGTTVEIDHGKGLTSQYANLAAVPDVAVGDTVSTGTLIGSVGATAAAENAVQPHLHFAMYQDGNPVSPHDYLPER